MCDKTTFDRITDVEIRKKTYEYDKTLHAWFGNIEQMNEEHNGGGKYMT